MVAQQAYPWEDRDYYKLMLNKVVGSCRNCHLVSFNCLIGGSVPRGAAAGTVKLSAGQCHLQPPLTALTRLPWNGDTSVNVWWWWWCDHDDDDVTVWPGEEKDNGDQPMIRDQWGCCCVSLFIFIVLILTMIAGNDGDRYFVLLDGPPTRDNNTRMFLLLMARAFIWFVPAWLITLIRG